MIKKKKNLLIKVTHCTNPMDHTGPITLIVVNAANVLKFIDFNQNFSYFQKRFV